MTMNQNQKMFFPWPSTLAGGWQRPGNAMTDLIDAQTMRMQHFAEEMQRAYADTYDKQIEVLSQTGERLSQSVQELMSSQGPAEMLSAESRIASAWLEGVTARSQHWLTLGQKLQQCCADFARASFEDLQQESEDLSSEVEEKATDTTAEAAKQLKAVKTGAKHAA